MTLLQRVEAHLGFDVNSLGVDQVHEIWVRREQLREASDDEFTTLIDLCLRPSRSARHTDLNTDRPATSLARAPLGPTEPPEWTQRLRGSHLVLLPGEIGLADDRLRGLAYRLATHTGLPARTVIRRVYDWVFECVDIEVAGLSEKKQREREHAYKLYHRALASGQLVRASVCERCGSGAVYRGLHGHHHRGYSPEHATDVMWLCPPCHKLAHVKQLDKVLLDVLHDETLWITGIRLPVDVREKLLRCAANQGKPVSQLLGELLEELGEDEK